MSQESTNRTFDDLARALAEGSISRRRALKLFAGSAIAALIPSRALAQSKMVTICHVPPGNPANAHTITVGEAAAQRHLEQHPGDTWGECQTSTTTTTSTPTSTTSTSTSTSTTTPTSTTSTSTTTPPPPPVQCDNALNDCSTDPCICGTGTICVSGQCVQAIQCDNALNNCATDPCICGTGTTCVSGSCI